MLPNRTLKDPGDWKVEALALIDAMWDWEDSVPFRIPVNQVKYPGTPFSVTWEIIKKKFTVSQLCSQITRR